MIVDKDGGKLTTQGNGMRLGIQNSLEIVNGLFELAAGRRPGRPLGLERELPERRAAGHHHPERR